MNILIYRPQPAASRTARAVEALGHKAFMYALFNIEPTHNTIPQADYDNMIITSESVFEVGIDFTPYIYYPLYVVGKRTQEAARDAGFITVHTPAPTSLALSEQLTKSRRMPEKWLYLAGIDRKKDLEQRLTQAGHLVKITEVYQARATNQLPQSLITRLNAHDIDVVLHYSTRSADVFFKLLRKADLISTIMNMRHVIISERVSSSLIGIHPSLVTVSQSPDEEAVLEALKSISDDDGGNSHQ